MSEVSPISGAALDPSRRKGWVVMLACLLIVAGGLWVIWTVGNLASKIDLAPRLTTSTSHPTATR